jgi:hypothetical protein
MLWKLKFITIWVLNSITEFWAKDREWKHFSEAKTLNDRERHLALEMPTSRMAHAERGTESTPAKQHQGKDWITKAQQDWPINVAINSRLLVCKAYGDKIYTMLNPH